LEQIFSLGASTTQMKPPPHAGGNYLPHLLCKELHTPEQQSPPLEHELPSSKQAAILVSGVYLVIEATSRGCTEPSAITEPTLWNAKTNKANAVVSHRNLTFMTILPEACASMIAAESFYFLPDQRILKGPRLAVKDR
jgi:hypothetical protein